MEAIRGCALGRRSARDPGVHHIRVARASERARKAFAARGNRHERAAAHGMGGEAAGHARAKANTRRVARGAGRGRDWGNLKLRRLEIEGCLATSVSGAVASLSVCVCVCKTSVMPCVT